MKKIIIITLTIFFMVGMVISCTPVQKDEPQQKSEAGNQPLMQKGMQGLHGALKATTVRDKIQWLKRARWHLNKAARNKGGHRVKAIKLINMAIRNLKQTQRDNNLINHAILEVQAGIDHANRRKGR